MTQEDFLLEIASRLDSAGILYMVVGSHGSSFHGMPRTTNDVDLVLESSTDQLERFLTALGTGE